MTHSPFPWSTHPQAPSAVFDADGRRINEAWSPPAEATAWLIHWGDVVPEFTRDIRQAERGRRCGCNVEEFYAASPPSPIDPETAVDNAALIAAIPAMVAVLKAYEQWEADIIMERKCWGGPMPMQITGELFDRMLEIQGMRNAVLDPIGKKP